MDLGLYHNSHEFYSRSVFGAVPSGSQVILRLGAASAAGPKCQAMVRLWRSNEGEHFISMEWDGNAFKAVITMPDEGCLLWYYFIVQKDGNTIYYGNNIEHLGGKGALSAEVPPAFQITVYDKNSKTPDWFKNAIVYQIFPDRFCHGKDTQGSLWGKKSAVIHSDWNDLPYYCKNSDSGDIQYYDFYGGNIAGIREKLPYLKELGVTVIYLNPIFESRSNHHYDTADYHRIDSMLGTNEEFADFCQAAKKEGIRIILDGVFSHTGADSIYFNRFGTYDNLGAYQSKDSPYYEWYRFKKYPDNYESWWGVMDLPDVEETTPSYMDFIIRNDDSVLKYWMRQGISGWRLDVIDELPVPFLRAFYKTLKEEDPDAVLIGEVWEDASNKISYSEQREYLCGYDIDSAMNYALRALAVDFVKGEKDARRMNGELTRLIENYPKENWYAMLNLISSHDIERILTYMNCDSTNNESAAEIAKKRVKILMAWQMTMPGAPCIYYGDEAGQTGGKDPDNRRTYPWGHEDQELLAYTKKLTKLRRMYDVLRTGRFISLYADRDVFAYARTIEGGRNVFGKAAKDGLFIIAMNCNTTSLRTISIYTDGLAYGDLYNALEPRMAPVHTVNSRFTLTLPPLSMVILKGKEGSGQKRAGIILHPTSLPSKGGNGDLGPAAFRFIDFLKTAGQSVWQILPLTPPLTGDSPYLARSAFAGNERLISLDVLARWGWLSAEELEAYHTAVDGLSDWDEAWKAKSDVLWKLSHHTTFKFSWKSFDAFCKANEYWLDDYTLFRAVSDFYHEHSWTEWPADIRNHEGGAVQQYAKALADTVSHYKFLQYIFHLQWQEIHGYAKKSGISILGDLPMFVAHNSADCWAHQDLFDLDADGNSVNVAGVPPDYFSEDGQLWGNPLYNYDAMAKDGYDWWVQRLKAMADIVDEIRIDHFRGLESYWSVPATAKTAREGVWKKGPGLDLLRAVYRKLGNIPLVAEDLGVITDEVCELKQALKLPGMRVLHFHMKEWNDGVYSFDTEPCCIAYTGTHDNNTTLGWYTDELDDAKRLQICQMLDLPEDTAPADIVKALIMYVYSRRAQTVIIPMQDILSLPGSCRMNTPGTATGNWHWQMNEGMLQFNLAKWLSALCKQFTR